MHAMRKTTPTHTIANRRVMRNLEERGGSARLIASLGTTLLHQLLIVILIPDYTTLLFGLSYQRQESKTRARAASASASAHAIDRVKHDKTTFPDL
jgi:hypothetical protein